MDAIGQDTLTHRDIGCAMMTAAPLSCFLPYALELCQPGIHARISGWAMGWAFKRAGDCFAKYLSTGPAIADATAAAGLHVATDPPFAS